MIVLRIRIVAEMVDVFVKENGKPEIAFMEEVNAVHVLPMILADNYSCQ
ncbi:MAG TPA: hypothetical protein PKC76_00490 [Saprospiraceae bacterium]|nr:hypothetical protein [Saprospiraceae bacterium]HMP22569.1 hypothetical protein [Saprospiraceae bacterium]